MYVYIYIYIHTCVYSYIYIYIYILSCIMFDMVSASSEAKLRGKPVQPVDA